MDVGSSVKITGVATVQAPPAKALVELPAACPRRIAFIEGMRGVAALYVLAGHVFTLGDPYRSLGRESAPLLARLLTGPFWFGHLAVAAFIVISGFCLQMSLHGRTGTGVVQNYKQFFKRRCRRILPPYYACLALSLVVVYAVTVNQVGLPWSQYVPVGRGALGSHLLMIHNLRPEWMYKINGVLWSIAIEFQLYFVFPALALLLRRFGATAVLGACGLVAGVTLILYPPAAKLYVWYLPLFALGMGAARALFGQGLRPSPRILVAGSIALAGAVIASASIWQELYPSDLAMGGLVTALLALGIVNPGGVVDRFFSWRPILFCGVFSYSIYLMHHPLLQVAYAAGGLANWAIGQRLLYLALLGAPLALAGCYLFHLLFERPFLRARLTETDLEHQAAREAADARSGLEVKKTGPA